MRFNNRMLVIGIVLYLSGMIVQPTQTALGYISTILLLVGVFLVGAYSGLGLNKDGKKIPEIKEVN